MRCSTLMISLALIGLASSVQAQTSADPPADPGAAGQPPIVIPREPVTVDPASSVPPVLSRPVSVEFNEAPLKDVVQWLQAEQKLPLVLDHQELQNSGILLNDPVSDSLNEDPLYLLLDRLRLLNLGWYVENGLVHLTSVDAVNVKRATSHLNIGDLLDAGYDGDAMIQTIIDTTAGPWNDIDGEGGEIALLGDVLFLRQTGESLREVAGLLEAIRKHGQRTFAFDSPKHIAIRKNLAELVSVAHRDAKLSAVLADLSAQSGIAFRFDREVEGRRSSLDRSPMTLQLTGQKLQSILDTVVSKAGLAWYLRDGVLWITAEEAADAFAKTAVFDVRDLCRDDSESFALQDAIQRETDGPWQDIAAVGGDISFPRPGTMVVRGRERLLDEVLELLENYRTALRASKPRTKPGRDPQEVVVRFYRLPEALAEGMWTLLPEFVRPETWKTASRQEAPGSLRVVSIGPQPIQPASSSNEKGTASSVAMAPQAVLIVTQTRAVQRDVSEFLAKVQSGGGLETSDVDQPPRGGGGMGGFGGGGFGGGFFQIRDLAK